MKINLSSAETGDKDRTNVRNPTDQSTNINLQLIIGW